MSPWSTGIAVGRGMVVARTGFFVAGFGTQAPAPISPRCNAFGVRCRTLPPGLRSSPRKQIMGAVSAVFHPAQSLLVVNKKAPTKCID